MANGDRKYTTEVHTAIITAMKLNIGYPRACVLAGLTYPTARAWLEEGRANPDGPLGRLAQDVDRIIADKTGTLERVVWDAATDGDVKAAQWLLERRVPGEYGTKSVVQVEAPSPQPAIPATITTEQLEAELEEYEQ
jgi:hypothetical protein